MKRLIVIFLFYFSFAATVFAVSAEQAQKIIENVWNEGYQLTELPPHSKEWENLAYSVYDKYFAHERIAYAVLGPQYAKMIKEAPGLKKCYLKALRADVANKNRAKFPDYQGTSHEVTGTKPLARNEIIVLSSLKKGQDPTIHLRWWLDSAGKIFDVRAEGFSPITTLRDEQRARLSSFGGNFEKFLRDKVPDSEGCMK